MRKHLAAQPASPFRGQAAHPSLPALLSADVPLLSLPPGPACASQAPGGRAAGQGAPPLLRDGVRRRHLGPLCAGWGCCRGGTAPVGAVRHSIWL
jgi:hypothetical protein